MLKHIFSVILLLLSFAIFSCASDEDSNACTGDPNQWRQLFNGKHLTGWKHVGPGNDTVEDGLIHTHGGMGLLYWTGARSEIASFTWSTRCGTKMTTPECSSAFRLSR